jgi:hypothetical protein
MSSDLIHTAVVTGGHSYDVIGFTDLFRELPGIQAYIQHIDDFASTREKVRDRYEVVLFYTFLQDEPQDEGQVWWMGKPKSALEHLGETGQGLVILHHALLAYRGWSLWNDIVGVEDRGQGFHPGQQIRVHVEDESHPITDGLADWDMVDETYTMADAGPGNHILLTTDHPHSMRTLAWTRTYRNARVFCLESGHNHKAFENEYFQTILARGIAWSAGRI